MKFIESNKVEKFFSVQDSLNDEYILEEKPLEIPSGYRYVKADEANDLIKSFKKESETITDEDLKRGVTRYTKNRICFRVQDKDSRNGSCLGSSIWVGLEHDDTFNFMEGIDTVVLWVASDSFDLSAIDIEYIFVNDEKRTLKALDINDNLYTIKFNRKRFDIPSN